MRKSHPKGGSRPMQAGVVIAATAAAVLSSTAMPAFAATTALTATSSSQIPTQGGLPIVVTQTGATFFATGNATSGTFPARLIGGASPSCGSAPPAAAPTATPNPVIDAGTAVRISDTQASLVTPAVPSAGAWLLCIYSTTPTDSVSTTLTAVPFGRINNLTGSSVGAEVISLTGPTDSTFPTGVATQFNVAPCPNTYAAVSGTNVMTATTSRQSGSLLNVTTPRSSAANTSYYVCVYNGSANTSTLVARGDALYSTYTTTGATPLPAAATLNPTGGRTGGGNALTVTVPADTFDAGVTPGVLFTRGACPTTYAGAGSTLAEPYTATVVRISGSKAAITVPSRVLVNGQDPTTTWNACIYKSNTTGALVAQPSIYTVAPTLSAAAATVTPASGPAKGGVKVTVGGLANGLQGIPVGTDVGNMVTASLGGSPLTNVRVTDANTLTGTTTMHAPGSVDVSVTTAAGTASRNAQFTYAYGINVTPNSAPSGTTPVLDITGAGFANPSLTWAADFPSSGNSAPLVGTGARVMLTDNAWNNQAGFASGGVTAIVVGGPNPITQCGNVLVISDQELICTLDLDNQLTLVNSNANVNVSGSPVPAGSYNITVLNTHNTTALLDTAFNYSVVSTGSTFTVAPF